MSIKEQTKALVESKFFENFILCLIILNGITLGLETSGNITDNQQEVLQQIDTIILLVFVIEIILKLFYQKSTFFKTGWNIFDFFIVALALFPASGPLAILRSLRILRVLRILAFVPQMRLIILALIEAIPGMFSIVGLIILIFYISAVLVTNLFGAEFDIWFGTLGRSMFTLFQIMTLESWSMGIVRPVMDTHPFAWLFFVPFILITSFAVINLFIGVIVNSMGSISQKENNDESNQILVVQNKLETIQNELLEIHSRLRAYQEIKESK